MPLENQKQRFRTRGGHKIYQKANKNRSKIYANRLKIGLKIGPKSVSKSVQFWGPKSGHLSNRIAVFGNKQYQQRRAAMLQPAAAAAAAAIKAATAKAAAAP